MVVNRVHARRKGVCPACLKQISVGALILRRFAFNDWVHPWCVRSRSASYGGSLVIIPDDQPVPAILRGDGRSSPVD